MPEGLEHQGERQALLVTAGGSPNEVPLLLGQAEARGAFLVAESTVQSGIGGAFDRGHRTVLESDPLESGFRPEASSKKRGLI